MPNIPIESWISFIAILFVQIGYQFLKLKGWLKKKPMEILVIWLEFFGSTLGIISVAGSAGVRIGNLPIQVIRFTWAGPVAICFLMMVFLIKNDLALEKFQD